MEKYTIVQHEQRLHWLKDCPVLLQSYALTKSNTNNSIFLQCKFENIADKSIKAMNIAVKCSDVSHQELANVGNFPYLDINVQPYTLFGDKTPVALPNNTTRNVCIIPLKIIFSDDTTWENTSERAYELAEYEQQPISSLGELADQYKRDLHKICTDSEKHNYLPANINGFTICGCSKVVLNNTESCPQCGINFQDLLNINDSDKLHDHLTQYEAALAEKAQQEQLLEQERLQKAALAKQKFKTTAKKVGIIGSGVIAIALLGVLTKQVIIPNVQYSNAEHKAQSGEYDEAIQAFISLGDFKDASEKVLETKYNWAKDKLAQGDTEGAISLFSTLGDYSDARAQITEIQNQTQYDKAMAAYQAKQYADAQSIFAALGSYKDSAEKATDCKNKIGEAHYSAATTALSKNDTSTALHEFLQAVPYKDSISQARKLGNFDSKIRIGQSCIYYFASDGSIKISGNTGAVPSVPNWKNLISFSAVRASQFTHSFGNAVMGLQSNGSVVTDGGGYGFMSNAVSGWSNLKEIVLGDSGFGPPHVVGLKQDGTVVAEGWSGRQRAGETGWKMDGGGEECKVSAWKNIKHIVAGDGYTAGLTTANTVVVANRDNYDFSAATTWEDIAFLSAGEHHIVGFKTDGSIVATGSNNTSQCEVSDWNDMITVCAGTNHTLGLKADGTVVATGDNEHGQCNTSDWKNIVAIWAGNLYSLGLKSDGTFVFAGETEQWQNDIADWKFW